MDVVIIGSGIGGMGAANVLAHEGHKVTVIEKNKDLGGRAGFFEMEGFRFDTGPTWYLMPDVFERYFSLLGKRVEDYLTLHKLQPTYRIYFHGKKEPVDIFSDREIDQDALNSLEGRGSLKLESYLHKVSKQYDIITRDFFYRTYDTPLDLLNRGTLPALRTIPILGSVGRYVSKHFSSDEMRKLLGYSTVFLGGSPYNTPALYSIMNHVDLSLGAYYPEGGIYSVIRAMEKIGKELGVEYRAGTAVRKIVVQDGKATGVELEHGEIIKAEIVVSNADMHHTETVMLNNKTQTYPSSYWSKRTMAPSAFILYLGVKGKLPDLRHHTLYFSEDWKQNFSDIFNEPRWPEDPSLYVCLSSSTDPSAAPPGCESLFVMVPIAAGLPDTSEQRAVYREQVLTSLETRLGIADLRQRIVCEKAVGPRDYESMFNSYKGTALGLAHTLRQTAIFRPKSRSKKVKNLYYTGSGTHPGIGLPVCLISAELVCERIKKEQTV